MMKFLGWLLVIFALFCVFGFVVDWVEVGKEYHGGKSHFRLIVNDKKISHDVHNVAHGVSDWFEHITK